LDYHTVIDTLSTNTQLSTKRTFHKIHAGMSYTVQAVVKDENNNINKLTDMG